VGANHSFIDSHTPTHQCWSVYGGRRRLCAIQRSRCRAGGCPPRECEPTQSAPRRCWDHRHSSRWSRAS
jgi:hypothetical protein